MAQYSMPYTDHCTRYTDYTPHTLQVRSTWHNASCPILTTALTILTTALAILTTTLAILTTALAILTTALAIHGRYFVRFDDGEKLWVEMESR
jgi:hypothetical protein